MIRREIKEHSYSSMAERIAAILDALDAVEHPPSATVVPLKVADPAEPALSYVDPDKPF